MKNLQTNLILIISLISQLASGQKFSQEFGKIGRETIELTEHPSDKDAEAVVMFDLGSSNFLQEDGAFVVVFERTTRIKILSEAGIKWAEVEIPYYQEGGIYEEVYDVEANTYNYENANLEKTPFEVSNIYEEKINNSWNVKKFALPNVKKGSVIEYKYKLKSQYKFNLHDWEFQWKIPVLYSEYVVKTIPFYNYSYLLQGASKFDIQESYVEKGLDRHFGPIKFQNMVYKYAMKDVPAFKSEEFITSINDYIIKIDFQLAQIVQIDGSKIDIQTTWEEIIKDLLKHDNFGKYVKKSEKIASKILDFKDVSSEEEKFNYVLDYVKANYNWNKRNSEYSSRSVNKFISEKHGNSADINLFTIGLLRASGIEAYPLLSSTRKHGKVHQKYAFTHFFNNVSVLAIIDGKKVLTDATVPLALNNRIPTRCINDKGLVIKEDDLQWIGLASRISSEIKTNINIDSIDNSTIHSSVRIAATEYDALNFRYDYTDKTETIKNKLEPLGYSLIDTSIHVQNQIIKEKPYTLEYKLTAPIEIVNEKIYVSPFLNETTSDNPLKQNQRTYPVDMIYPKKRIFTSTIKIPDGYKIDYLPRPGNINNKLFELLYSATTNGNIVNLTFAYSFHKSVYEPTDYSKIKYYFNEIVKKGTEKIVFSKIPTESK